jgi:hypothetical protein
MMRQAAGFAACLFLNWRSRTTTYLSQGEDFVRMKPFGSTRKTLSLLLSLAYLYFSAAQGQAAGNAPQSPKTAATPSSQSASPVVPQAGTGKDTVPAADGAPSHDSSAAKTAENYSKEADKGLFEDWNTLKIPSNLQTPDPMPPLVGNFPEFTRELVQVTWRPWDIIDLYVIKPVGVKNPPVILYLYSFPSDTDRFKDDEFARIATKNGFAAVGFVSALTGPRFHDRPTKEWFVSELPEALGSSVHDVQLILNYLDKRGDLDMTRVGMYGDGSGASIAIMAAAVDPRIQALDLFDPWGDWPDWLAQSKLILIEDERAMYLKPEFLKKVENLDPVKYLPQLKTQRVRLQYMYTDAVTPKSARRRFEAATPLSAMPNVYYYANAKEFLKSQVETGKMFDWLKQQLVPALATQETQAGSPPAQPAPAAKAADR